MIGQQVGRYRITAKIGEGGMGAVFEAIDEQIGKRVAIKVLHKEHAQNKQVAQRFINEAKAINVVDNPGVVQVSEFGELPDGTAYIVMELLKGETLNARLKSQGGRMAMVDALRLGRQIASALAAAHEKGIIHRDLKPDNIMLVGDAAFPGGERTKLLDFGIAKLKQEYQAGDQVQTRAGVMMGTPLYMAPEQHDGRVADAKADQKYIVVNADEGDSATFADRMIMEGDPFTLIEGMVIAGIAVGATKGYVYLRSEYPNAILIMNEAVDVARRANIRRRLAEDHPHAVAAALQPFDQARVLVDVGVVDARAAVPAVIRHHADANDELAAVWDEFVARDDLWVGTVTGAGGRAFSAGNDLKVQAAGKRQTSFAAVDVLPEIEDEGEIEVAVAGDEFADVVHRARSSAEQLDDSKPVRLCEGGEGRVHDAHIFSIQHIPVKTYSGTRADGQGVVRDEGRMRRALLLVLLGCGRTEVVAPGVAVPPISGVVSAVELPATAMAIEAPGLPTTMLPGLCSLQVHPQIQLSARYEPDAACLLWDTCDGWRRSQAAAPEAGRELAKVAAV